MFYTARACARTHTQVTALRGDVRRHVGRAFKTSRVVPLPDKPNVRAPTYWDCDSVLTLRRAGPGGPRSVVGRPSAHGAPHGRDLFIHITLYSAGSARPARRAFPCAFPVPASARHRAHPRPPHLPLPVFHSDPKHVSARARRSYSFSRKHPAPNPCAERWSAPF
jgi:hypothetical protein